MTLRCLFCNKETSKGGNGFEILHHTFPRCLRKTWMLNEGIPKETRVLIAKSRIPLCKRCHEVFHILNSPLIELLRVIPKPHYPSEHFLNMFKGVDEKYGVRSRKDKVVWDEDRRLDTMREKYRGLLPPRDGS